MARSFWFVAGAGAGVYAMSRARRIAEAATVDGMRDRLEALRVGARIFRDEVAAGQVEKETELRQRLGLVPPGLPELGFEARSARTSTTENTEARSARTSTTENTEARSARTSTTDSIQKRETPDGHQ